MDRNVYIVITISMLHGNFIQNDRKPAQARQVFAGGYRAATHGGGSWLGQRYDTVMEHEHKETRADDKEKGIRGGKND